MFLHSMIKNFRTVLKKSYTKIQSKLQNICKAAKHEVYMYGKKHEHYARLSSLPKLFQLHVI